MNGIVLHGLECLKEPTTTGFSHPELGWIYHSNDQTNGVWIWIEKNFGWSWTGADLWPYFWVNDRADWIYYLGMHTKTFQDFWDYTQQSLIR